MAHICIGPVSARPELPIYEFHLKPQ